MLSPEMQAWRAAGSVFETEPGGHSIFYRDVGDPDAVPGRTLLLLHGFPESSYSFHKVLEGLSAHFDRVVLFDLLGYGLSAKPEQGFAYTLVEQADVALQVWRNLGVSGGHLLAHDMGDSVATELLARHVSGLLPAWFGHGLISMSFTNGSMVLDLARLRVTQRLLLSSAGQLLSRLSNRRTFNQQIRSAHGTEGLSPSDLDRLWENVCLGGGQRKTHLTIKYLEDRRRYEKARWLPALARATLPIHLCWGASDAVARVEMAHYLKQSICTGARLTLMPGVGHFCQLSDPDIWLDCTNTFFRELK